MDNEKLLDFLHEGISRIEETISEINSDAINGEMNGQQLLVDICTLLGNCMSHRVAIEDKTKTIIRDRQKIKNNTK